MAIIGAIAAVVIAYFMGPYGITLLLSVTFGMILSVYSNNKAIHADLQLIKQKLDIIEKTEISLSDEEIEKELQHELDNDISDETEEDHDKKNR